MERLLICENFIQGGNHLYAEIEIPMYSNLPMHAKFKNFLENQVKNKGKKITCKGIDALEAEGSSLYIHLSKCVRCMACFCSVKDLALLKIPKQEVLSNLYSNDLLKVLTAKLAFRGNLIHFPYFMGNNS